MIIDLERDMLPERANVPILVAGAGPVGIALALELERLGLPVLLLEAGGLRINMAGQDAFRAHEISPANHGPVHRFRSRVFGGTSTIWGGRCIPLEPIDLEDRPWIPYARWPISYADLAAHYPRALELCRAGDAAFTASEALAEDERRSMFDMVHQDILLDRLERFSEPTDFGAAYEAHIRCSRSITAVLNAPVMQVHVARAGRAVAAVSVRAPDGHILVIRAGTIVLALGALETARLLLCSDGQRACGLGNEHDVVGRFYQSHLEGHVGELMIQPGKAARLDYTRDRAGIYCRRYVSLSASAQRRDGLAGLAMRPTHPKVANPQHRDSILSAMFLVKGMLPPEYAGGMNSTEFAEAQRIGRAGRIYTQHVANIVRGAPRLAGFAARWTQHRILARRKLPSVFLPGASQRYPLDINAEQAPDPNSRIRLSEQRDHFGQRRISIDWRVSDEDRLRVARGVLLADEALRQAGIARIEVRDPLGDIAALTRIGGHHLGTARMADSPREGVVDGSGQLFEVPGLYVLGTSTFPTSGFANPTLTAIALAVRMAAHLSKTVRARAA